MAEWKGLDQIEALKARLAALPRKLGEECKSRVEQKTHKRTGTLVNSLELEVTKDGFLLGFTAPYAPDVEYGTRNMDGQGMMGTTVIEAPEIAKEILRGDK